MALEKNKLAAQRFGEDIGAGFRRTGQQLITLRYEIIRAQLVEARMRDFERRWNVLGQPVVGNRRAVVDTGTFCREPMPLDAVEMQDRGVRGKARPDPRAPVVFRPVADVDEVLP